jgi:hypothetical protein
MLKSILIASATLATVWCLSAAAACPKVSPLFRIERSKNKNIVQYEICVSDNGDAPQIDPVKGYWILQNGQREELNAVQRKFAYGFVSQEKLGENRFAIVMVALRDRRILIERIGDDYRAIMAISGKQSVLETVFVKSEERLVGLPKVQYIDLFGRTVQTGTQVNERIVSQ